MNTFNSTSNDVNRFQPLIDAFQTEGMVVLGPQDLPLTAEQRDRLINVTQAIDYVKVVGGDTGDKHSVWVGRFINDVDHPTWLHPLTSTLLDIVMAEPLKQLYCQMLRTERLCVRRCQANRLEEGDFIVYHVDKDTPPDYLATAIFQLSDQYTGGEFILEHPQLGQKIIELPFFSVLINRGDIPHWVTPVTSGQRHTVACFLSTNFGQTQKPRVDIQISQ